MLFSDDIEEILRAAAQLSIAREVRLADSISISRRSRVVESQQRDPVEVAEEVLELAVRVAVERSRHMACEWEKVRDAIARRR